MAIAFHGIGALVSLLVAAVLLRVAPADTRVAVAFSGVLAAVPIGSFACPGVAFAVLAS